MPPVPLGTQDKENQKMKLYISRTCPYCIRVTEFLKGRDIPVELVDVPRMHSQRTELQEVSGQTFVPTLVDGDTLIADDDDAIIQYLSEREGASVA